MTTGRGIQQWCERADRECVYRAIAIQDTCVHRWRRPHLPVLVATALCVMAPSLYAQSSQRVVDSFAGATATALTAHAADVAPGGNGWTVYGGAPTPVLQNGALRASGGSGYVAATIDSGISDGSVTAEFRSQGTPNIQYAGVVFRAVDNERMLLLRYASTLSGGILQLFQRIDGEFIYVTGEPTAAPGAPGDMHRLEARFAGNAVAGVLDGTVLFTTIVERYQTATRHGVLWHVPSDASATFDHFSVATTAHGVLDGFAGANGTPLTARAANVSPGGAPWTLHGAVPAPVLQDGRLRAAGGTGYAIATIESGISNGRVSTEFRSQGSSDVQYAGVVFRAVDSNRMLLLRYASSATAGFLELFQRVGGDFIYVAGTSTLPPGIPGAPHRLEARFSGPTVEALLDDAVMFTASVDMYQTATRHGVLWHVPSDPTATFDQFVVTAGAVATAPASAGVLDSFTGGNGVPLAGRAPTAAPGGAAWTVYGTAPAPVLQDGALRAAGGTGYVVATADAGISDGRVAVDFRSQGTGVTQFAGVVFRAIDSDRMLLLRYASSATVGALELFQRVSGDFLYVAGTSALPPGQPNVSHRLEARFAGNRIEALLDHVVIFTATVDLYARATRHGVLWHRSSDGTVVFDNFAATPLIGDTSAPFVAVTTPTTGATFATGAATLAIEGSANDAIGVRRITWSNHRGGSGTASGTTSWSASVPLHAGVNIVTLTAYDEANNAGSDMLTITYTPPPTPPRVTITSPTSGATHDTAQPTLIVGGVAADDVGVTQVTWSSDRGSAGVASGTSTWSVHVPLSAGRNAITVTARDGANNTATDVLTVTYTPESIAPAVTIVAPSADASYDAATSTIRLAGAASDNLAVTQVTWRNSRGGNGVADGTASWSASVALQPGANVLTVIARDAANNTASDTLIVNYVLPTPAFVLDTFVRDTQYLKDHVLDQGPQGLRWRELGGTSLARLVDGQAASTGSRREVSTVDVGVSDVQLRVEVTGKEGGLVLRATDARNYLMVLVNDQHSPALYRFENGHAGSPIATGRYTFEEEWETHHLEVRAEGDRITVYLDRGTTPVITATVPFQRTATRHGLFWPADGVTFDNFELRSPQPVPPSWPRGCVTSVTPEAVTVPFEDDSEDVFGTIAVSSPPDCYWGAESSQDFARISSGGAGSGNGTFTYRVDRQSGGQPRSATLTVGGRQVVLTQTASPCRVSLSPPSSPDHAHYRAATGGQISLVNSNGCTWNVTGVPSWMMLLAGAGGTASGTIRYELTFNSSGVTRVADLIIANQTYRITQLGVASSGTGTGNGPGPGGGSGGTGGGGQPGTGSCAAIALPGIGCWDTFAADVTIRRSVAASAAAPIAQLLQPTRYRWERSLIGSTWHTTLTMLSAPDDPVAAALGAAGADLTGARIEDDGAGMRVYGPGGSSLPLPSDSLRSALGLSTLASLGAASAPAPPAASRPAGNVIPHWVENFVFTPANRDTRLAALAERFGASTGIVRGLHQYVAPYGDRVQEVLFDPGSAVIREANVTRNGALVVHTRRSYAGGADGSLVLQAIHTEHLVSADSGERATTEIEFANIRFERRR